MLQDRALSFVGSMSGRVDLSMPDDVFRVTSKGLEFIGMKTNTVDTDKSQLFTELW